VARAGDVLENPATGDRLTFLKTAAETGGEALEYEITFKPGGFAARDHLHPLQEERHEVLEGTLGIVVAGNERRLGPGDVEVVPVGTQHRIFTLGDDPVRMRFESRPALESEVLLETLFGLARDGKVNARGEPGLLQLSVIFRDFADLGRPTRPPKAVQTALLAPLAALGRARGYRSRYPEYSEDSA
jgi:quercetin dioxygenase-like cupin family protein